VEIDSHHLDAGMGLLDALRAAGLAASNSEARRHVQGNAVRVNDEQVSDPALRLGTQHVHEAVIKLSVGRKRHVLLKPV
jgi:tyrosyl-tRNA synthetase